MANIRKGKQKKNRRNQFGHLYSPTKTEGTDQAASTPGITFEDARIRGEIENEFTENSSASNIDTSSTAANPRRKVRSTTRGSGSATKKTSASREIPVEGAPRKFGLNQIGTIVGIFAGLLAIATGIRSCTVWTANVDFSLQQLHEKDADLSASVAKLEAASNAQSVTNAEIKKDLDRLSADVGAAPQAPDRPPK